MPVTRAPSVDDERGTTVTIAADGRDILAAVFPGHIALLQKMLLVRVEACKNSERGDFNRGRADVVDDAMGLRPFGATGGIRDVNSISRDRSDRARSEGLYGAKGNVPLYSTARRELGSSNVLQIERLDVAVE